MLKKVRIGFFVSLCLAVFCLLLFLFVSNDLDVLKPSGPIAEQQSSLLIFAFVLSMFVILPVFALTIFISLKYREGNKSGRYRPNNDGNFLLESLWWGIPIVIILILSVITLKTSHSLDPSRSIASDKKPLQVEVVALQWNWLFIYPEEGIATTNYLNIPTGRPISFSITSDAPMNSFWIPKLGGQIYAMSGMTTRLHLQADEEGAFEGSSANISGTGFSDMYFSVNAIDQRDFDKWVENTKLGEATLNRDVYAQISTPGSEPGDSTFASVPDPIFDDVRHKYDFGHDHGITYKDDGSGYKY